MSVNFARVTHMWLPLVEVVKAAASVLKGEALHAGASVAAGAAAAVGATHAAAGASKSAAGSTPAGKSMFGPSGGMADSEDGCPAGQPCPPNQQTINTIINNITETGNLHFIYLFIV